MVIGFLHNPRRFQAPAGTRLHQAVIGRRVRPTRKANKGHVIQVLQSEFRLSGQRMPFRRCEHNPLLCNQPLIQFFAQCAHADYEARIKSARPDSFYLSEG